MKWNFRNCSFFFFYNLKSEADRKVSTTPGGRINLDFLKRFNTPPPPLTLKKKFRTPYTELIKMVAFIHKDDDINIWIHQIQKDYSFIFI